MTLPRHLVSVWNPSYGTDVMESHLRILRKLAQQMRSLPEEEQNDDDVYVWWGKIRSRHRQQPLPHMADILALEKELGDEEGVVKREMQMYITDYRSLYVAHIGAITSDDVRETDDETHIPPLYLDRDVSCDCWFMLWDIRRLISDDTPAVIEELKKLNNVEYHNQPVSIYGGMRDLPLIVTRPDGARYFDHEIREQLTEGRHWVEFDSEYSGIGSTERELREHCFGEDLWAKLDPGTRTFIATAEKLYRDHRGDTSFDFSPILIDLAKAFEVQTNILLKAVLGKMSPADRRRNIDGKSRDLCDVLPVTLGALARLIAEDREINDFLKRRLAPKENEWFAASLPAILRDLAEVRNASAHSKVIDRELVQQKRNQYLGVGCEGDLVRLAKVRIM